MCALVSVILVAGLSVVSLVDSDFHLSRTLWGHWWLCYTNQKKKLEKFKVKSSVILN